ncbi:THO2 plays a role in transcriptional elongation [Coemansia sp. RSA 2320]|nr:THO2 plays a role in transcriptional elongation [Coemansia sp. RSA 2320]
MQHNEIRRKVRSVMRRLSGDTVKLMGRQLCNLCHPSPTLSMKVILDQVCSYDNLVDSVVEAFRYLTPLDADVLFYVILKILDDPNSTKVKDDSVNAAHWLQSLSLFIASYSYRHESPCLDVVLDYVLKRTVCAVRVEGAAPVPELTIVSDSILKLAAIDVMANATEEQTLALQGGHYLNSEAFSMVSPWVLSQDASIETVLTASTDNRLIKRMASWLTNLIVNRGQALSFAIALSVHAEKVVKMASLPLSNVLVIYDREIERVYQLFHLLHSNLKPEKYSKLIPGPHTLVSKYGLSWGLAILWGRPSIAMHLAQGLRKWEDDGERVFADITEQDVDETSMECVTTSEGQLPGRQGLDAAATQIEAVEPAAPIPSLGSPGSAAPANAEPSMDIDESEDANPQSKEESRANEQPQVVASLKFEAPLLPRAFVDHIARALPAQALSIGLSAEFVAVFWTLTPFDIEVPAGRYKKEIEIQSGLIKRVDALAKQSQSRSKAAQLAQIRSRATLAIDNLEKEMLEQRQHVSRIRRWLIAQKDYWFCMAHEQRKLITQALLQHCILPRAILSASDAGFCAKFLWMMHYPWATNKFSLMIVYDNVFSDSLSTLLAALTENEARSYAKFLNTSLAYLAPLHLQETQYRERAVNTWRGLTGFQQQSRYKRGYLPPQSRTIRQQTPSNLATGTGDELRIMPGSTMLSHDDFRTVMRKWQVNLTKAFISTLDSERNDTVRNGILALREMQKTFPVISQHGRRILDKVTEIAEGGRSTSGEGSGSGVADSNKNLKVMATSYGAYLGMAKKSWISESSYYPAPSKDVLPRSPQPSNLQASGKQATHATAEVVEVGGGGSTPRASRGDKESSHGKTNAENKPDKPQDERARTTATRRHVSAGAATVAAAAAVASVSATASTASPAMAQDASRPGTVAQKEKPTITSADASKRPRGDNLPSADESGASRDQDSKRYRERGRGRQRERQHESDSLFPPRPADHGHRDSRSVRDSPLHADRDDLHTDAHQPKRGRDESAADGKLEPPRQRLATPTNVGAARGKSPVTPQVTSKSPSPSITSTAAKAPSEDVDRKRKELRAQLLKQQEEKQKQKQDIPQSAALPATPTEPREQNARGESAHQAGRERPTSDELKDGSGSGNRRDRRVPSRHQDSYERAGQQQHQQLGPNSGRDKGSKKQPPSQHLKSSDQGSNGRSDTPPQAQKASAHDRQQQPRVQTHLDSAAQGTHSGQSGRADRGSQRHGRGGGGSRNHSPPPRGERYAPAGETAAIRITGSRYNAKPESNRPANGDPPHRKGGPGDAHQPNENNDGGGNGQRRGPKRGRGIDGREWNDGKRYRK